MPIAIPLPTFKSLTHFLLSLLLVFGSHSILALPDDNKTPMGSIQAGNADGSIPPWQQETALESYYESLSKAIAQEQPLYTVDASNYQQYTTLLSAGQIALFKHYPATFTMPIYPSHRSAQYPPWFIEKTQRNAGKHTLNVNGELTGFQGGFAFPSPVTAEEVMWNHLLAWRGVSIQFKSIEAIVNAKGEYTLSEKITLSYLPFAEAVRNPAIPQWIAGYYLSKIIAPAKLNTQSYLVHESIQPLTKPRQSWFFIAPQKRSQRAPYFAYDSKWPGSGDVRTIDEFDMFNGALDRYDWEILDKKEMLIPYNNETLKTRLSDDYIADVLHPLHINPAFTRYERHRVWRIQATLKKGMHHIYPQRTFYLDEDTWSIIMTDMHDAKDKLTRFSIRYVNVFKQLPGVGVTLDSHYDLENKRYLVNGVRPGGFYLSQEPLDPALFSPKAMRKFYKQDNDHIFLPEHKNVQHSGVEQ